MMDLLKTDEVRGNERQRERERESWRDSVGEERMKNDKRNVTL